MEFGLSNEDLSIAVRYAKQNTIHIGTAASSAIAARQGPRFAASGIFIRIIFPVKTSRRSSKNWITLSQESSMT
jgi:hypothetical protein